MRKLANFSDSRGLGAVLHELYQNIAAACASSHFFLPGQYPVRGGKGGSHGREIVVDAIQAP